MRNIITVHQGDYEHYGEKIKVEACVAFPETENQQ